MRFLQIVILTLIVAYPDDVLSRRRRTKDKENKNGPCGKKYLRQISGKCYYFAGKKMNWYGAQNNCLRKGLNLVDLSTEEEFKSVIEFLRTRGNMEDYWFGGNDLQTEGRFSYISNGKPVKYLGGLDRIEATQRANLDDCLEVRLRQNSASVTDENCLEQQYFVCTTKHIKCGQPTEEPTGNEHHSHEHLHHFHHDPAKAEDQVGNGNGEEGLESDSRPGDNTNTAEVGNSQGEGEGPEPGEGEGEGAGGDESPAEGEGEGTGEGEGEGEAQSPEPDGEAEETSETSAVTDVSETTASDATDAVTDETAVTEENDATDAVDTDAREETTAAEATA